MEYVRLLLCLDCKSLDEVPDFEGRPEDDFYLEYFSAKHETSGGTRHRGNLVRVPKSAWDSPAQAEVLKQIKDALGGNAAGLGSAFYNTRNQLVEDAMTCFGQHMRNPACSDYKSSSKELSVSDELKADWKDVTGKKRPKNIGPKKYLCEFCPVDSLVKAASRSRKGLDL